MSVSTSASRMIAPYVADMDASGAATFDIVQQESYQIDGVDYEFDATLSDAKSVQLLDCFTVTGKGPSNANPADPNFNVELTDPAALQALLMSVINGEDEASSGGNTATSRLVVDLHTGLIAAIAGDNLINTAENVDVSDVSVTIDSSGGAANMAAGLTENRCKLIYTQVPKETLNLYMDASENATTSALLLKSGDKLTFVFDIHLSDVVPVKAWVDVTTNPGVQDAPSDVNTAAPQADAAPVAENYTSSLHYDLATKRVAFNVQLSSGGAAFEGLKLPAA